MEFYAALVLALTLAAVAAVLFYYAMFLEARGRQMKKYMADLERVNLALAAELQQTKARLEREVEQGRALWPEVLDESGDFSRN